MAKTCRNCGNQLPDEANICLDCFSLCNEYQQPIILQKKNYKKTGKSIIAILSSLLMLIGCYTSPALLYNDNLSTISNDEIHNTDSQDNTNKLKSSINKVYDFFTKNDENSEESNLDTSNTNKPEENSDLSRHSDVNPTSSNTEPSNEKKSNNTTHNPINQTAKPSSNNVNDNTGTDSFDYSVEDEKIVIKKYTGNATNVVIPDKIDGLNVYKIKKDAFIDNSKIKSVTFKDSEDYHTLWIEGKTFQNLSSLEKIVFPKNTDLGIMDGVCSNCTKLSQIYIDNWQYKMVDGGLYYYNSNSWSLQYLCEGLNKSTLNIPSWCSNIYVFDLLKYNKYVTTINVNSHISSMNFIGGSKYIKEVNVDPENPYIKSIDGIVYNKRNQNYIMYYPYAKTAKTFVIPDNTYFILDEKVNNYVETLKIPASVTISKLALEYMCENYTFENLKTIYVEKTSPYAEQIESTFTGKTILY